MSNIETGGPAFPTEHTDTSGLFDGMTLRDYFAAKALAGELASPSLVWKDSVFRLTAKSAYEFADAMLKARK